jgi:cytochrome c oxidase subunit II
MNTIPDPVTQVDTLFVFILGFSLVLLTAITVTMIAFVIRYRRSQNPEPSDIRGNWKLELAWIVIPTIIAFGMFYFGWQSYLGLRTAPDGAIEIEVYGQMYSWIFVYPNEKETENELVVPVDAPVRLTVTSEDVLHSLFIPAFRIKIDAVNGRQNHIWFHPKKTGEYMVLCAEFCGVGHADMTATLRVVTQEEYDQWLESDEDE